MAEKDKKANEDAIRRHIEEAWGMPPTNWRAFYSWSGWASPVGLALFFIGCAIAFWIVMQAI